MVMQNSIKHRFCVWMAMVVMAACSVAACAQEKETKVDDLDAAAIMKAMSATAQAFRNAADSVRPSLVTIESYGGVSAVQGRIGGIRKQGEGNTTGLMISPDGYVLTSTFNFIQKPPVISVITSDGERRFAKLLGRDDTRKLCLLKVEGVSAMPVPETTNVEKLEIGQWAISLGVGYGDTSPAISTGIISAKNRIGGRAVQTDANISPANYGGPLIDIKGRVIGICVPLNPQSQAIGAGVEWYDSGIGFAIPLEGLDELIGRLKKGEWIAPGFVGIQAIPNPEGDGLYINRVVQDSPASKAGLLVEDILLAVNEKPVGDMLKLKSILNRFESGDTIQLTVKLAPRKGEDGEMTEAREEEIELKLARPPRPKGELEPLEPPKIR